MVRTVLALLTLMLLAPTLVAADPVSVTVQDSQHCRVGGLVTLSDCAVSHTATTTLTSCDATSCNVTFAVAARGDLTPGVQTIDASVVVGVRTPICDATQTTTAGEDLNCFGQLSMVLPISGACRLVLLETTGASNKATSASLFSQIRVCKDGTLTVA